MTKTVNQIIFFFLHQNQNIFFNHIRNQNIFLEKTHNPPPPLFKLNGRSLIINNFIGDRYMTASLYCIYIHVHVFVLRGYRVMVFNATFNDISVLSWRSVLFMVKRKRTKGQTKQLLQNVTKKTRNLATPIPQKSGVKLWKGNQFMLC